MDRIDYKELSSKIFCYAALGLLIAALYKYAFPIAIPFLVSWLVAYAVFPLARDVSKKIRISRKICSFVLVLSFLFILVTLAFLIVNRLLYELQNLIYYLNNNSEKIAAYFNSIFEFFDSLGEKLPIVNKLQNTEISKILQENINSMISSAWNSVLDSLGSAVPDIAARIVMSLPDALLSGLIAVISCFYFAMDIDLVNRKIKKLLPKRINDILKSVKRKLGVCFKKYIKAYVLIFLITFIELLIGFFVLRLDYAFVLALIIAILDFLPLIGTGAILLPWGIILLLMNNLFQGMGILILFVITTIVRQVIEPKILGDSLGVHPLITLISIYIGYKLFGIFGMIFMPLVTLFLLSKEAGIGNKYL